MGMLHIRQGRPRPPRARQGEEPIVQDRELLEGASPAKVLEVARDWVASIPNVTLVSTSRHRYCIVIDDKVMEHLLQLPMPAVLRRDIPSVYSVKVYDLTFGVPDTYYGAPSDSDDDDDDGTMSDEDYDGCEGWFWVPAHLLLHLWFVDGTEAGLEELYRGGVSMDGEVQLVYCLGAKLDVEYAEEAAAWASTHSHQPGTDWIKLSLEELQRRQD
jgi:hypothetical protein